MPNPFTPGAGVVPHVLIGREDDLSLFEEGLVDGFGAPGLLTLITGPRGSGKTVLLREAESLAKALNWVIITETAADNSSLIEDIHDQAIRALKKESKKESFKSLSSLGIDILGVGVNFTREEKRSNLRAVLTELGALLTKDNRGLLLSIDEVHSTNQENLRKLSAIRQHLVGEKINLAMLIAGLPQLVEDLIDKNSSTSFLRRAEKIELKNVPSHSIKIAFQQAFEKDSMSLEADHLRKMVHATQGYPFMIQLVGYQVWRRMARNDSKMTDEILAQALSEAYKKLGNLVFLPEVKGCSPFEKTFLIRLAQFETLPSRQELAESLNKDSRSISVFRSRLMTAGIISSVSHGKVDFVFPYMRQYLREHAASLIAAAETEWTEETN